MGTSAHENTSGLCGVDVMCSDWWDTGMIDVESVIELAMADQTLKKRYDQISWCIPSLAISFAMQSIRECIRSSQWGSWPFVLKTTNLRLKKFLTATPACRPSLASALFCNHSGFKFLAHFHEFQPTKMLFTCCCMRFDRAVSCVRAVWSDTHGGVHCPATVLESPGGSTIDHVTQQEVEEDMDEQQVDVHTSVIEPGHKLIQNSCTACHFNCTTNWCMVFWFFRTAPCTQHQDALSGGTCGPDNIKKVCVIYNIYVNVGTDVMTQHVPFNLLHLKPLHALLFSIMGELSSMLYRTIPDASGFSKLMQWWHTAVSLFSTELSTCVHCTSWCLTLSLIVFLGTSLSKSVDMYGAA